MKSSTHDKAEGTAKIIEGQVKEVTGNAIGNPRLQAAGKAEKSEGKALKTIANIEKALGN
jgi:uncharacterized protein YjbJ (UPF0337 family)